MKGRRRKPLVRLGSYKPTTFRWWVVDKRGDRVDIKNYIKECGYNSSNKLEDIINETIHDVLDSIDTSLMYLSDDIDSGIYSNKDIIERIREIRSMIV